MGILKKKRYIAILSIIALFLMIISISLVDKTDKYKGLVKVEKTSIESKLLGSVGDAVLEDNRVQGNSTIEYIVSFTLDEVSGITERDAIIKGTLTPGENKYARFKPVSGTNIESTLEENGKGIEVRVRNVRLGEEKTIRLKLVIENAPSTVEIHPSIKVSEATGSYTTLSTDTITVETNSLEGQVKDENNLVVGNIEVVVRKDGREVKKAYTNDEGKFTITDLEVGTYELDVDEEIYEANKVNVEVNGRSNQNLKVRRVEPYKIETHKYIERLKLIVDGKEQNYTYNDQEKVLETIRKANEIKGEIEYKLVVKNIGEKSGTISQVKDESSEGLKLKEGNYGWEEKNGTFYYRPLEGVTLEKNETREVGLVLEIESTSAAKTYINKMTTKGEIYEKVVYILDGEVYREEEVLEGETIEEPIISNPNFSGWYTDINKSNKYNFNLPVEKDLILYGNMNPEAEKYRVRYIVEGEVIDSKEVEEGDYAEEISGPTLEGKDFLHWSLEENGESYNFNTPITQDTDLYGVYKIKQYTVTFINEGSQYGEIETVNYGEKATRPSDPSKEYYTFKYWHKENVESAYDFNTPVKENIILYSEYEINKYNVKFIDEGEVIREGQVSARKCRSI